ncbi:MAG: glycerol-3-phosphate ABC transporter permease [Epulopiscium sp. Nele67-Bin004]|nr:MAG: glycerol-3-phosphate ABC transporter permease [Epulopiscium sp. Nele67-Bin004]
MEPYLYLTPAIIFFMTFVYVPFLRTIVMSFSITNLRGEPVAFVGFQNYIDTFSSASFINSIKVTFQFVGLVAVPSILVGLALALLASKKTVASRAYELMFSTPMAIASAPAAIIWTMIFHPTNGLLSYVLQKETNWLADPSTAIFAVAAVTIWLNIGINFIYLLTGVRNIPGELIESSEVDGATYFQKLYKIMLPMLSPQLFFVFFLNIIMSFQAFGQVRLLTQGGPEETTNVLVYSIYREAFFYNRFEMACVQSLVLFAIMLVFTLIQFKFEKKGVHYQ